jgi:GSH-dependent disulfide-bond oxidoreductase
MNQAMSQGQLSVFESRAISQCLAEKTRQFLPKDLRGRTGTMADAWPGPMPGQNHHFSGYAPEKLSMLSSADRKETGRLYAALDHRCLLL